MRLSATGGANFQVPIVSSSSTAVRQSLLIVDCHFQAHFGPPELKSHQKFNFSSLLAFKHIFRNFKTRSVYLRWFQVHNRRIQRVALHQRHPIHQDLFDCCFVCSTFETTQIIQFSTFFADSCAVGFLFLSTTRPRTFSTWLYAEGIEKSK